MSEVVNEAVVETVKKEEKKGKWTYDTAMAFMRRNGQTVGTKTVELAVGAGIHTLGCADYLKKVHGFTVYLPVKHQ